MNANEIEIIFIKFVKELISQIEDSDGLRQINLTSDYEFPHWISQYISNDADYPIGYLSYNDRYLYLRFQIAYFICMKVQSSLDRFFQKKDILMMFLDSGYFSANKKGGYLNKVTDDDDVFIKINFKSDVLEMVMIYLS